MTYAMTAWAQAIEDEHRLLSPDPRHPRSPTCSLPEDLLDGPLAAAAQLRSIETDVGRPKSEKAEFWTSIGGRYKTSIDYALLLEIESGARFTRGPEVRTQTMRVTRREGVVEELQRFGGTVSRDGAPVANAWVALPDSGRWASSRDDGRFDFGAVRAGEHRVLVRTEAGEEASGIATVPGRGVDVELTKRPRQEASGGLTCRRTCSRRLRRGDRGRATTDRGRRHRGRGVRRLRPGRGRSTSRRWSPTGPVHEDLRRPTSGHGPFIEGATSRTPSTATSRTAAAGYVVRVGEANGTRRRAGARAAATGGERPAGHGLRVSGRGRRRGRSTSTSPRRPPGVTARTAARTTFRLVGDARRTAPRRCSSGLTHQARARPNVATMVNAASKLIQLEEAPSPRSATRARARARYALSAAAGRRPPQVTPDDYVGDTADRTGFGGLEAIDDDHHGLHARPDGGLPARHDRRDGVAGRAVAR